MNTPLIPKSSRNTLVGGEQERFYLLLPCHVANVAEGKKEFVVLGKIDEKTNYANLNWYDAKVFSTNYGHNQAHALRPSPCSKTKVRQAEAVFMHSRPTP